MASKGINDSIQYAMIERWEDQEKEKKRGAQQAEYLTLPPLSNISIV